MEIALGRLKALDFMKGLGLVIVLLAHWSMWWTDHTWTSASAFALLFTRFLGIPNFTLMSIIGLMLSLKGKEETCGAREQFTRVLKRAAIFLFIGSINNIIYAWDALQVPVVPIGWKILFVLFSCNVLTFIGIAQIALVFFKRLHVAFQVVTITAIILAYYAFLPVITPIITPNTEQTVELLASTPATIVYTFFFMENTMAPLIPSLAVPFLASVVYARFSTAISAKPFTMERVLHELRFVRLVSITIMVLGITIGATLTTGIFSYARYTELVLPDATRLWTAPGYPLFFHLTHPSYVLFSFGALSLLLTLAFEAIDIKARRGRVVERLAVFGKYSLTIYLLNPIAIFFPIPLNMFGFIALWTMATSLSIAGTWIWETRWEGKYSVDWFIRKIASTNITLFLATLPAFSSAKKQKDMLFPA